MLKNNKTFLLPKSCLIFSLILTFNTTTHATKRKSPATAPIDQHSAKKRVEVLCDACDTNRFPLIHAAENNHETCIKILLKSPSINDMLDIQDDQGNTAIIFAADKGFTNIVNLLIEAKALTTLQNKDENTALMFAVLGHHEDSAKALLNACDAAKAINMQDSEGESALMLAAREGLLNIIHPLIGSEAQTFLQDKSGITSVMIAAKKNDEACVMAMLDAQDAKQAISIKDSNGLSALSIAASQNNSDLCRSLLKAKAPVDAAGVSGYELPIMLAAQGIITPEMTPRKRKKALTTAVRRGDAEIAKMLSIGKKSTQNFLASKVMLLLDDDKLETPQKQEALTKQLFYSVLDDSVIFIAHRSIFNNFLLRLFSKNPAPGYKQENFDPIHFDIYYINQTGLFVLLPKQHDGSSYNHHEAPDEHARRFPILDIHSPFWKKFDPEKIVSNKKTTRLIPSASGRIQKLHTFVAQQPQPEFNESYLETILASPEAITQKMPENTLSQLKITLLLSGHGLKDNSIAGISLEKARNLIKYMNTKNISILCVDSCHAGGSNRQYLTYDEDGAPIDLNYTLAFISTTDSATMLVPQFSPTSFFDNTDNLAKALGHLTYPHNPFFRKQGIHMVPLYRTGAKEVVPCSNDPKVMRLEDKEDAQAIKNKSVILLDQKSFGQSITIAPTIYSSAYEPEWIEQWNNFPSLQNFNKLEQQFYYPVFQSLIPGDAEHNFSEIIIKSYIEKEKKFSGILTFIRDAFLNLQGRRSEKTFTIDKLTGFNDFSEILSQMRIANPSLPLSDFEEILEGIGAMGQNISIYNLKVTSNVELNCADHWNVSISFDFAQKRWEFAFDDLINQSKRYMWNFVDSSLVSPE